MTKLQVLENLDPALHAASRVHKNTILCSNFSLRAFLKHEFKRNRAGFLLCERCWYFNKATECEFPLYHLNAGHSLPILFPPFLGTHGILLP